MNMLKIRVALVGITCLIGIGGLLIASEKSDKNATPPTSRTFASVVADLKGIRDIADVAMEKRASLLEDLIRAVPAVRAEEKARLNSYVGNVLVVLDWLSSCDFGDPTKQNAISQVLAWDCLQFADKLSWGTERWLLQQLRPKLNAQGKKVVGADWSRVRNRQLEFQLHLWRRINNNIDPNWNPKKMSRFDPSPYFKGQSHFLGGALENIRDPKQRKLCKKAHEEHIKQVQIYNTQYGLRKLRDRYLCDLKRRIERLYRLPPVTKDDLDILKAYLRIYVSVSDKKLRSELFQIAEAAAKKAAAKKAAKKEPAKKSDAKKESRMGKNSGGDSKV